MPRSRPHVEAPTKRASGKKSAAATPEEMASVVVSRLERSSVRGRVMLPLRLDLPTALAERLVATGIREQRRVEAIVLDSLEKMK